MRACVRARARACVRVCVCVCVCVGVGGCIYYYIIMCLPYLTGFDLIAVAADCLVFQNCDSAFYLWFVLWTGTGVKTFC